MPPKISDNAIKLEQEVDSEKVIVTGAGSGIGKELVKLFLQDGSSVLAVSLFEDELDSLREECKQYIGRLDTLKIDLSEDNACESVSYTHLRAHET